MMGMAMVVPNDQYEPWWIWPAAMGSIAALALLLWLLNRLFPSTKEYHSAAGNALMRMDAMLLPDREHIIEARERDDTAEDEKGEPPNTEDSA